MRNIHSVVEKGEFDAVKKIVASDSSKLAEVNNLGDQPLHTAASQCRKKIAEFLLDSGADIDARGDRGQTALAIASKEQCRSLVKVLLERGADPNITDDLGTTALFWAAGRGDTAMVRLLLKHGATKDLGASIYIDGPDQVFQELKSNPGLLTQVNKADLLVHTIRKGSPEFVAWLLDNGVSPNQRGRISNGSPLLFAVTERSIPKIRLLLDHGADIHAKDLGSGILKLARTIRCPDDVIQVLQEYGATD